MKDNFDVALGELMRENRKRCKLSATQVGEKVGITHQMVSLYELGKSSITVTMLIKFCDIYGIKYYDIIKEAGIRSGDEDEK